MKRLILCMALIFSFLAFVPAYAEGNTTEDTTDLNKNCSITIRSTYQVNNGGSPEYVIKKDDGTVFYLKVDRVEGNTIKLPEGNYKITETKTKEGFVPMAKDGVYITLPHKDEKGDIHYNTIIEMKSDRVPEKPQDNTPNPSEPIKNVPVKDEPKGEPIILGERPEENKPTPPHPGNEDEETPEQPTEPEKPVDEETTPDTEPAPRRGQSPKTGDSMVFEILGVVTIAVLLTVLYFIWKNKNKEKTN